MYDYANHAQYTEWIMSQKGFNLLVMQFPLLVKKSALVMGTGKSSYLNKCLLMCKLYKFSGILCNNNTSKINKFYYKKLMIYYES
jgi:hypothetical protein